MKKRKISICILFITFIYGLYYFLENMTKAESAHTTNVYEKLDSHENINYLIIGDSIGRGAGAESKSDAWFSKLEVLLNNEYHIKAKRHSLVQSGATAFEGFYKIQESKHFGRIDLTFIVFGENDRKYMHADQFAYFYEELLRKAKTLYPDTEIITITESCLDHEEFAHTIKSISAHYGAKNIDMRVPFKHSGLPVEELTTDMVHPNGNGYQLYAETIFDTMTRLAKKQSSIASLTAPLHDKKALEMKKVPNFIDKEGFTTVKNGYFNSRQAGDMIEFEFTGSFLGVNVIRNENGGKMDVFVDEKYINTLSTWWPLEKERNLYITSNLADGLHRVKFVVTEEKPGKNFSGDSNIQLSSIILQAK